MLIIFMKNSHMCQYRWYPWLCTSSAKAAHPNWIFPGGEYVHTLRHYDRASGPSNFGVCVSLYIHARKPGYVCARNHSRSLDLCEYYKRSTASWLQFVLYAQQNLTYSFSRIVGTCIRQAVDKDLRKYKAISLCFVIIWWSQTRYGFCINKIRSRRKILLLIDFD